MSNPAKIHFIRPTGHSSRRNFGGSIARKRGESNFLRAFERAYFAKSGAGIAANEFALAQHGVADLVWIAWLNKKSEEDFTVLTLEKILRRRSLIAFEAKLKDWQQALRQAFRYRYFADKSIVVMPEENANPAISNLSVFEEMNVGLWTFNKDKKYISRPYTPVNVRALNQDAREKAIKRISSQIDLRKLRIQA